MVMNLQEYALFLKGYAHGVFDSNPFLAHARITTEAHWDMEEKHSGVVFTLQFMPPSELASRTGNSALFKHLITLKAIEDNQDKQLVLDWSQHFAKLACERWEKNLDQRAKSEPMRHAIAAMQRPNVIRVGAHLDAV